MKLVGNQSEQCSITVFQSKHHSFKSKIERPIYISRDDLGSLQYQWCHYFLVLVVRAGTGERGSALTWNKKGSRSQTQQKVSRSKYVHGLTNGI